MPQPVFLMSPPRLDWHIRGAANVFSQSSGETHPTIPAGAALREWLRLADAMVEAGARIAVLPSTDDPTLTGMPYTAEAGHLGRDARGPLFLLPRVKPPHRRAEAAVIEALLTSWGLRTWTPPVLWEGQGDVLDVGDGRLICTSGVGSHARTAEEAYDHVAPLLPGTSLHLRFHAEPWFHGNTFLGFFHRPQQRAGSGGPSVVALVCDEALLPGEREHLCAFLPDVQLVTLTRADSLRYATNALQVGSTILAPVGVPLHVEDAWRALGLRVRHLELPVLFGRGGGAAVCMTNRLALSPDDVPGSSMYDAVRDRLQAQAGRA